MNSVPHIYLVIETKKVSVLARHILKTKRSTTRTEKGKKSNKITNSLSEIYPVRFMPHAYVL